MMPLSGKVAIVTGGSRGIGRAIVLELALQGCDVAFNYRESADEAATLVAEVQALGRRALSHQADVTSLEQVEAFFAAVVERFGTYHYLVNNAGITRNKLLMSMSESDWQAPLDVNLTGAYHCARAAITTMMKQREGRILNVSSAAALKGLAGTVAYSASKAGLLGLTRALAKEVGRYGVTVNAVAPGFIETDMIADLPAKARDELTAQIALGRFGEATDVASTVAFLLSPGARYITGQVITIDGGLSA
ncbi:MAG: 3-oxoacyl-[acyl-carrier-protein] reductase [Cyanobacteria bacterium RYN_339]|nr:3-oxoacyl-[acyl-carrier-protein] reductase [Cyanobacteria bacterium RYN_339]